MGYNPRMASSSAPTQPPAKKTPPPLGEMLVLFGVPVLYILHFLLWPTTVTHVALDMLAFVSVLFIGLAVVSQFLLPVQTWGDRWRVLKHVVAYFFGAHGPIIFVKQGRKIARANETATASAGQGVAVIDPSSAIVLQRSAYATTAFSSAPPAQPTGTTEKPLVRAHGPGVCFIEPGEVVVATLDLRPHKRSATVRALTRDGIEVTANVGVTFGLNPQDPNLPLPTYPPGERNRPAYPFNPRSAFKAIYGQALGEKHPIPWTELPLSIATEAFRDVLAHYWLEQLFALDRFDLYPFAEFQSDVSRRVQDAAVLLERGIAVRSVKVTGFEVPAEVLNQRVRVWQTQWRIAALEKQAVAERKALEVNSRIRLERQRAIVNDFVNYLLRQSISDAEKKALVLALTHALQRLNGQPAGRLPQRLSWQTLNQSASQMIKFGGDTQPPPDSPMSDDDANPPFSP